MGRGGRRRDRLRAAAKGLFGRVLSREPSVPEAPQAVRFVDPDGRVLAEGTIEPGTTLLRAAHLLDVDISSYCGGQCSCGTCRVDILAGDDHLTPRIGQEAMVLGAAQVSNGERLACQARVLGPVTVRVEHRY